MLRGALTNFLHMHQFLPACPTYLVAYALDVMAINVYHMNDTLPQRCVMLVITSCITNHGMISHSKYTHGSQNMHHHSLPLGIKYTPINWFHKTLHISKLRRRGSKRKKVPKGRQGYPNLELTVSPSKKHTPGFLILQTSIWVFIEIFASFFIHFPLLIVSCPP